MPFQFEHLAEPRIRQLMLDEVRRDLASGQLYLSGRLSAPGCARYPQLLRQAIRSADVEAFAEALGSCMLSHERRLRQNGLARKRTPRNAARVLAEGEFNRYYIRAVCRFALEQGHRHVCIYRGKFVESPRPESRRKLGRSVDAEKLLEDLRAHVGDSPSSGVPSGPGSGLTVRLQA